ncbi:MAG: methylated-DNA--[protein]-cysteine S-methyltransferase [Ilumatobacteraceae bacterium]
MNDQLFTITIDSPVRELRLIASDSGMRAILWHDHAAHRVAVDNDRLNDRCTTILQSAADQLDEYFRGKRESFDLPLDPVGSPFQQAAWLVLRTIPYGQTITYGEQARRLGDPNKARAVGAANGRNPLSIVVPCHRVIGATGKLTGFAGGIDAKAWLLDHERGLFAIR